jgi:hypothetical protein
MGQADIYSFYGMPEWLLLILFLAAMVAAGETGYRLGRHSRADEKTKALVPTVAASIIAVVGLLLGFTMTMAVSRYDTRRRLVLEEANAIDSAYWRAQALPAPESGELKDLLRRYVDVRLYVSLSALNPQKLQQGREEAEQLQNQLFSRAAAVAQKDPRSMPASILMESLDTAFEVENSRWSAFGARVPDSVIYVNAIMGLVAALLVGYDFGIGGHRHLFSEAMLIAVITVVLGVIVDLDRPHSGVVRVSQQPLIDLQHRLAAASR